MPAPTPHSPVRVHAAGFAPDFVPYAEGLRLQQEAVAALREQGRERPHDDETFGTGTSTDTSAGMGTGTNADTITEHTTTDRGTLFMLEHEAVYTAGRRALPEEYPSDGTPVVTVDRGGKVTWHGPGQLVAYPVIRLRNPLGVVDLVRSLESIIIATIGELGVEGFRVEGRAGVWVDAGAETPSKVAQIGIHTSDGIVTHGLAINCSNDLAPFKNFVPCGITDAGVTTLSHVTGRRITPSDVAPFLHAHLTTALEELAA